MCDVLKVPQTKIRVSCKVLNIVLDGGGGDFLIARFEFLIGVLVKIPRLQSPWTAEPLEA